MTVLTEEINSLMNKNELVYSTFPFTTTIEASIRTMNDNLSGLNSILIRYQIMSSLQMKLNVSSKTKLSKNHIAHKTLLFGP